MSESGPSLPSGAVCYALSSRGDGTFHWALAFPTNGDLAVKMHAKNPTGSWNFERIDQNIRQAIDICVVVKIGELPLPHTIDSVCELLSAIPMEVPDAFKNSEKTFTCRVWVKEAWRVMAEVGVIECSDVAVLEEEVRDLATENDPMTIAGHPFKLHVANSSK